MSQIEFLKYEPTPGEKHFGIATVRLYGKIVLRYKIVASRDGAGFFPCAASYKMPATAEEAERYVPSFLIDSNYDKDEIETTIKAHIKLYLTPSSTPYAQSQPRPFNEPNNAFGDQGQQPPSQGMTNQGNYAGYQQQQNYPPQQQRVEQPLPGFENVKPQASWPPNDGMPF